MKMKSIKWMTLLWVSFNQASFHVTERSVTRPVPGGIRHSTRVQCPLAVIDSIIFQELLKELRTLKRNSPDDARIQQWSVGDYENYLRCMPDSHSLLLLPKLDTQIADYLHFIQNQGDLHEHIGNVWEKIVNVLKLHPIFARAVNIQIAKFNRTTSES